VVVHVCDGMNMRVHSRGCVYSPYWTFAQLMEMRRQSHELPNTVFDFSVKGARAQERDRQGFFLNEAQVYTPPSGDPNALDFRLPEAWMGFLEWEELVSGL
jgi:hypothetical protein